MPQSSTPHHVHRRRGSFWFYLLLLAVAAGVAYWYVNRDPGTPAPAGPGGGHMPMRSMFAGNVPVRVANAQLQTLNYTLQAIGTVEAFNTVTVRSRVDGELLELLFDDGQRVEQGDVLARIDPRTYQVQLDQAHGQLAQTRAQLKNAQLDLQRYEQLFKQNSLARQQLDTQRALVEQLRATEKTHQAAVDNARLQLDFTEVTAPISGRLGLRQVDVGNLVSANAAEGLVVITQIQPISVRFSLPQADLPDVLAAVRSGRSLPVRVLAADGITVLDQGELVAIDNQIDVGTGTVSFKAWLPNADEMLFPNQFVNVQLGVDSAQQLAVPVTAVQYGSIGAFVYVVDDDNAAHIREVVPGRIDGDYIAISAGLSPGERVVTDGVDRLREGSKVEVVDTPVAEPARPSLLHESASANTHEGS